MSQSETKMPLNVARDLADRIVGEIMQACTKIEVAGSIRRRCEACGDIEIVAIPLRAEDLLGGQADSLLDPVLDQMCFKRRLVKIKGGDKYKQFHVPDPNYTKKGVGWFRCKLDLFLTDQDCWPVILAIRTGPAEFSRRMVTPRRDGGLLHSHLKVKDGRVWDGRGPVKLESEEQFFSDCLGIEWVEPNNRT